MTASALIYSIFLFFGLFSFAGGALLLIQFKKSRPPYITYWAIGSFSICIGVGLLSFCSELPEWLGYKLSNGLTFAAAILFNSSLCCLSGRSAPLHKVVISTVCMSMILIGVLVFVSAYFGPRYQPAVVAIEAILLLNKQGVKFALDDFGTGFSSLTYLQKLPIQYLKIDKSFVAGLGVSTDDEAIASNLLRLARGLGIKVIAEGVEAQSQFEWLHSNGCDFFQGWYFGRPSESFEPLNA